MTRRAKKDELKPVVVKCEIRVSKRVWDEIEARAKRVNETVGGLGATPEEIAAVMMEMGLGCVRETVVANGDPTLGDLARKQAGVIA